MLDTPLLHTLAAVVREGSFERAARSLHLTPSAVSQRIRQAEERVGTVLVVRGQPCTATVAGARLCRHAQTVSLLENELRRDLPGLAPEAASRGRSTLRVAINADSLGTWFVDALASFAQEDETLVDVLIDDQDHTGAWLQRGHVLAAVTSTATPVQGCRSRKLGAALLRHRQPRLRGTLVPARPERRGAGTGALPGLRPQGPAAGRLGAPRARPRQAP